MKRESEPCGCLGRECSRQGQQEVQNPPEAGTRPLLQRRVSGGVSSERCDDEGRGQILKYI